MTQITSHVLDTSRGRPASGLSVALAMQTGQGWTDIAVVATGADGRIGNMLPSRVQSSAGVYRLRFEVADYFGRQGIATFYPYVDVVVTVEADAHYHVPLLLSPFGYSTYRGS